MVTYQFIFGDDYVTQLVSKHRARVGSRWLRWPLKLVCGVGVLSLAAMGVFGRIYPLAVIAALLLALMVAGPYLDYVQLRWRFRKHPQFGETMRIDLSDADMKLYCRDYESVIRWSAFSDAKVFGDGILLYQSPWDYTWLQDTHLTSGAPLDARAIVRRGALGVVV
jgi:hypothetical protein